MKRSHRALHRIACAALLALTLPAVAAPGGDLARCAAIGSADERLACYDTLVCGAIASADERLACFDKLAKSGAPGVAAAPPPPAAPPVTTAPRVAAAPAAAPSVAAAPPASGTAAPAAAFASDPNSFGLVQRSTPVAKGQGLQQIKAVVTKVDTDLQGVVHVSLDNGQVWTFVNYERVYPVSGETVTIHRAALGSFLMTTASRRTVRVARTQ
jgi:hypothetical protein